MTETLDDLLAAKKVAPTLELAADKIGISVRALADLRAGKVAKPRRSTVLVIAARLRVKPQRVEDAIAASYDAAKSV